MKAILEFNLPEDREEFELAQNGWKYKSVVDALFSWLRAKYKYEDVETLTIDEIREKIVQLQKDEDLL